MLSSDELKLSHCPEVLRKINDIKPITHTIANDKTASMLTNLQSLTRLDVQTNKYLPLDRLTNLRRLCIRKQPTAIHRDSFLPNVISHIERLTIDWDFKLSGVVGPSVLRREIASLSLLLAPLTNLTSLSTASCSSITYLTNLQRLVVRDTESPTRAGDFSVLTNLRELHLLAWCNYVETAQLVTLTNLTNLSVKGAQYLVSFPEPQTNLTRLSLLSVGTDTDFFEAFPNLKTLQLNESEREDEEGPQLSFLTNLTSLEILFTRRSLDQISLLTNLTSIELFSAPVEGTWYVEGRKEG